MLQAIPKNFYPLVKPIHYVSIFIEENWQSCLPKTFIVHI